MAEKNFNSIPTIKSKQISSKNSSSLNTTQSKLESTTENIGSQEISKQIIENYIILWLDKNFDFSNENNQVLISQLQRIVNKIRVFNESDQCLQCLAQIKSEKVFLIISDVFSKQIASIEEDYSQLTSIYIFCSNTNKHDSHSKAYKKGKGIFTHMKHLCNQLEKDVRRLEKLSISGVVIPKSSNLSLNDLPPSFMYCQLLKENFLKIENDQNSINKLAKYIRSVNRDDSEIERDIDRFQTTYNRDNQNESPIFWYTKDCLYKILNTALRTLDVEILMKMNFFIRDLHKQIAELHLKLQRQSIPQFLYRGQGLPNPDFENLRKNTGGLWFFNNFLSTSSERGEAKKFLDYITSTDLVKILFEIEINSSISTVPFAQVDHISNIPEEKEVLFSIGSVFRIDSVEEANSYWRVKLSLTSDRDPILCRLTDHIQRSLGQGNGWRQLGQLMIKMGKFAKAEEVYGTLMHSVKSEDKKEQVFLHNQLGYVKKQMGDLEEALKDYQHAVDCSKDYMAYDDPQLSSTYSNIGAILKKLKDFDRALQYFQLALKIDLAASKPNRLEIAIDYNNIGSVLDEQGNLSEALKNYEKALEIKLVHLSPNDPSLANNYSNIGVTNRKLGDYSKALTYYEKTLSIQEKSLLPDHPSFIVTHSNMATAFESLGEFDKAIEHAEEAKRIAGRAFGSEHPETKRRSDFLDELRQRSKL